MRRALSVFVVVLIASLAAPAAALGGGCHNPMDGRIEVSRVEGAAATAHAAECGFYPAVLYVDQGAEVTWTNKDPVPHTITGAQLSWGSEEAYNRGEEVSFSFPKDGVFPYYCVLHPGMVGAVVVGDPDPDDVKTTSVMTLDQELDDPEASTEETSDSSSQPMTYAGIALAGALAGAGVWFLVRRKKSSAA